MDYSAHIIVPEKIKNLIILPQIKDYKDINILKLLNIFEPTNVFFWFLQKKMEKDI